MESQETPGDAHHRVFLSPFGIRTQIEYNRIQNGCARQYCTSLFRSDPTGCPGAYVHPPRRGILPPRDRPPHRPRSWRRATRARPTDCLRNPLQRQAPLFSPQPRFAHLRAAQADRHPHRRGRRPASTGPLPCRGKHRRRFCLRLIRARRAESGQRHRCHGHCPRSLIDARTGDSAFQADPVAAGPRNQPGAHVIPRAAAKVSGGKSFCAQSALWG